ncbi:MAG: PqqD family protein [Deltaproteobacteria bacterium]|jgi:hypothetical protein|nr:PqqD family protein [Deltaproteobacteria bacterium]
MKQHHQVQWDNIVPKQILEWEDGPEERAVLLVPRFRKGPLARWLQPRLKRPFMRVSLDEFGSFVWKRIDGRSSYSELHTAMTSHFGEKLQESDERLQKFLTTLQHNQFAELLMPVDEDVAETKPA